MTQRDPNHKKSPAGTTGLVFEEPLLFDQSVPGRRAFDFAPLDVDEVDVEQVIPAHMRRPEPARLPEVSEPQAVRHFTRLSQWNYGVDSGLYPLGSCTMKYNPKVNEWAASLPGFQNIHPYLPSDLVQGAMELIWHLTAHLCEITGLAAGSLQPAAGAQGEFTGLKIMRAAHDHAGDVDRKTILVPDSAHGTNPASCTLAGLVVKPVKSSERGVVEPGAIADAVNDSTAGIMITNPSTLGLFEEHMAEVADIVHRAGGLVYLDGANMNSILGRARPGDMGVDVLHLNLHKTFSTPHGGGGPGSGPVLVTEQLEPFLPNPNIVRGEDGTLTFGDVHESSIGRVRSFHGNFLMLVRAYAYIRTLGPNGLRRIADLAVLNANYVRARLGKTFNLAYDRTCMHECVFDDTTFKDTGIKTLDIAKRLIDYGFHPPTVYFPLNVHNAIMFEPTENETRDSLDEFCEAMLAIADEIDRDPELLRSAPHHAFRRRLDETQAARKPRLTRPLD